MRRKLIKQGVEALTVTLPAKWLKERKLGAGDEVDIEEEGTGLIISGTGKSSVSRKVVDLAESDGYRLRTIMASAYKSGFDEIVINFKKAPDLRLISEIISTFTGLEMVSQEGNSVVIKSFLKLDEAEINNLILKMFQGTKQVLASLDESWSKVDIKNMDFLVKHNILKLRDHCLRAIHSTRYGSDMTYDYYDLVTVLEKTAAEIRRLAETVSHERPNKSLLFMDFVSMFDDMYVCYQTKQFSKSHDLALRASKLAKTLLSSKELPKLLKKENPSMVSHYYYLARLYVQLSSRLVSICS